MTEDEDIVAKFYMKRSVVNDTLIKVQEIFDEYKLVLDENYYDYELLKAALVRKHVGIINHLLKLGCRVKNPNKLNSEVDSAIHLAMKVNNAKIIKTILKNGASINEKNFNGDTALYTAFIGGHEIAVRESLTFVSTFNCKGIDPTNVDDILHFHIACVTDHYDAVKYFIDGGIDVNRPIYSSNCSKYAGYTPLHIAVMHGCEKVIKLLLKNAADCKKESTEGTTPLHLACNLIRGELKFFIIEMLLRYNACPAAVDKNNCTPLHLAFWNLHCYQIILRKILNKLNSKMPRETNFTDNNGLSHFHIVCIGNDISLVIDFLKSGVNVNNCVLSKKFIGYTALHFAALYNYENLVEVLLKWNAQVDVQTKTFQLTPLHLACNFNNKKFLEMHNQDDESKPDLISSCLQSQFEIIKLLLLHGANVDAQNSLGQTPLLRICEIELPAHLTINTSEICTRLTRIIEILLLNKANINACTTNKEAILHIVSKNRYLNESVELVEYLLTKGANVHAVNNDGFTPLHIAVKSCKKELVKILLKHQADVNAKSKNFLIPLQMIIKYDENRPYGMYIDSRFNEIASSLLENGSYVNVRNKNSKTLLQIALGSRNICLTKILLDYGADINMKDILGDSPVSCLFHWKHLNNKIFTDMYETTFVHVQKLLALGLYVSEKVQKCFIKLRDSYESLLQDNTNLDKVFDNCLKELDKMNHIKIDNYNSLYNILIKDANEISKLVRNSTLIQILEDPKVDIKFPMYSFLLKLKYKKGLKRNDVLKIAREALRCTIKLNLPDLCCDSVLKYLSNEDIINFKAAVSINFKRKLCCDDSFDAKSSKLKKI